LSYAPTANSGVGTNFNYIIRLVTPVLRRAAPAFRTRSLLRGVVHFFGLR